MPEYEYMCPCCGRKERRFIPESHKNIQECSTCGAALKENKDA